MKLSIAKLTFQKINKLARLYNQIIALEISFRTENSSTNDNKVCAIRLIVPSNDLMASARCKTFEVAISKASEALERQIEKRKTKLIGKH